MNIDKELVDKVSSLCRINIPEEEKEKFIADFAKIVRYVEKVADMDTENEQPAVWGNPSVSMRLREDIPHECLTKDEALMNAPSEKDGCFKVPRVVAVDK